MANYKRKVTYFYHYQNGIVGTTAGFLKIEIRGEKVKITVNIQENHVMSFDPIVCFYHEADDELVCVKVCDIRRESGVLTLQKKTEWRSMFDTERDLYSFDGVIVYYNDNDYYLGDFEDRDRKGYSININYTNKDILNESETVENNLNEEADPGVENNNKENDNADSGGENDNKENDNRNDSENDKDGMGVIKDDNFEKCKECPYRDDPDGKMSVSDSFSYMIAEYPKLPMYGVSELFDCVRIHPRDIGRLDIGNWKLGVNSFLTHGYYTYQYLMLGNMRFDDGRKHPVLGVPGVYSNRERYLAGMFGFDQFIPVKKTGAKTGQFGYWIVELNERNF